MCQGKMPQSVRERYIKMKENPEHPANLDLLIKNFDCALPHPDTDDLEKLKKIIMNKKRCTSNCQSADRSVYRDLTLQQRKISSIIL